MVTREVHQGSVRGTRLTLQVHLIGFVQLYTLKLTTLQKYSGSRGGSPARTRPKTRAEKPGVEAETVEVNDYWLERVSEVIHFLFSPLWFIVLVLYILGGGQPHST